MVEPSCRATPSNGNVRPGPTTSPAINITSHDEVGDHDAAGSPRHHNGGNGGQVIADDDGVGGLQGVPIGLPMAIPTCAAAKAGRR